MKLTEYYSQQSSIQDDIDWLIWIDEKKKEEINILILNIVLKYITLYLDIKETHIELIKDRVHELLAIENVDLSMSHWELLFKKTTDRFWITCLLDIRQTSAIFKEIALDNNYIIDDGFKWLDLWSWTWILTLAMGISWLRKWAKNGQIYYIDQSVNWINKSTQILQNLWLPYDFSWKIWDILDKKMYIDIPLDSLSYLVSETIWNTTPSFSIDPEDWELIFFSMFDKIMEKEFLKWDPFPSVVSTLTNLSPTLYQKIKNMKTWMFPNFLTKRFVPDDSNSKLLLRTWTSWKLELLKYAWKEFDSFQDLWTGSERWISMSDKEMMNMVFESILS